MEHMETYWMQTPYFLVFPLEDMKSETIEMNLNLCADQVPMNWKSVR